MHPQLNIKLLPHIRRMRSPYTASTTWLFLFLTFPCLTLRSFGSVLWGYW